MSSIWAGARRIALRIEADTLRGVRLGVPRLVDVLQRHAAGATFLFNVGPDHSGRALGRILRQRRIRRAAGTNLMQRHGLAALFYGTLLPAPHVDERCADIVRSVHQAGFETGIRALDSARWRAHAARASPEWTLAQMQSAGERYQRILGEPVRVHAAPGCQVSRHSLRLTQRLGYEYCSDTRGTRPYIAVYDAEIVACPQIPVTLPGFAQLLDGGVDAQDLARHMFRIAAETAAEAGHVLSVQADLEGMSLLAQFDALLGMFRAECIELLSLGAYLEAAGTTELPRHRVVIEPPHGGDGNEYARQGAEFLA